MSGQLRFPNVNNVIISGRLVRDVEIRYSANGQAVAPICIAVNHYYQDGAGNWQEQASFVDAVAFGKNAQTCQECLKKGSPVLIEGSLRTRTFVDKAGVNKKVTEVNANRVYPLERDENFVPNQNYHGHNNYNNAGYQNQNPQNFAPKPQTTFAPTPTPPTTDTPPVEPPAEPSYQSYEQQYPDVTTHDDVPF